MGSFKAVAAVARWSPRSSRVVFLVHRRMFISYPAAILISMLKMLGNHQCPRLG